MITEGMMIKHMGAMTLIAFIAVLMIVLFHPIYASYTNMEKFKLIIEQGIFYLGIWLCCIGIIKTM